MKGALDFEYEIQGLNASQMDYTIKQFTVRAGKHWKTLMLLPFFFVFSFLNYLLRGTCLHASTLRAFVSENLGILAF